MPVVFRPKEAIDKMRPRIAGDVYQTPFELALATCVYLRQRMPQLSAKSYSVLDPGAGSGVWGKAAYQIFPRVLMTGIEIRRVKMRPYYTGWYPNTDFLETYRPIRRFQLIVGNPPFNQAEAFIRRSIELLNPSGVLCFLLPSDFIHSQGRGRGLFKEHPPVYIAPLMQRPNFTGPGGESLGKAQTDNFSLMIWTKYPVPGQAPTVNWLDWKLSERRGA